MLVTSKGSNLGSSAPEREALHNLRIEDPPPAQTEFREREKRSQSLRGYQLVGNEQGFEPWFERR
ncbi:MAG: hypothetical protein L3J39_11480 [Verrucomicrobiales bacterium]|nr:hypothetical protein [Verrucomicrobiales bacterium]